MGEQAIHHRSIGVEVAYRYRGRKSPQRLLSCPVATRLISTTTPILALMRLR